MSGISDQELRERLIRFNFTVPPITESTRSVLLRKLKELEKNSNSSLTTRSTRSNSDSRGRSQLLDYSSAEEDGPSSSNSLFSSRIKQRESKNLAPHSRAGNSAENHKPIGFSKHAQRDRKLASINRNTQTLYNVSDSEDNHEDENIHRNEENGDEDPEEIEELDDEEEDGSEDLDDDYDEEDDEDNSTQSKQLSVPSQSNSMHFRGPVSRQSPGGRFENRSSANLNVSKFSSLSNSGNAPSALSNFSSPFKKVSTHGDTNDAPDSRLRLNAQSNASNSTNVAPVGAQVITQVESKSGMFQQTQRSYKYLHSLNMSKIIIASAVLFFGYIIMHYINLKPSTDIDSKLTVCDPSEQQIPGKDCVPEKLREKVIYCWSDLFAMLETKHKEASCEEVSNGTLTVNYMDWIKREEIPSEDQMMVDARETLVKLMIANPQWGISVLDNYLEVMSSDRHASPTFFTLTQPPFHWSCKLYNCWNNLFDWTFTILYYFFLIALSLTVVMLCYKIYVWRKERKLQEHQEVFEMIEQILSVLAVQHGRHQQSIAKGVKNPPRPWVPITHIRDELIRPESRKKKARIWKKAVQYIRDSESRVREDIRQIYGEDHRCWQWLPDIQWSHQTHPGPHPYLNPFQIHPMSHPFSSGSLSPISSGNVSFSLANNHASPTATSTPAPASPASPPSSSSWQGSVFNSLGNKNLAVPSIPPTQCLKVRHLFDPKKTPNRLGASWVRQVKEEVLRRASSCSARILHIFVDTESAEGCVYIKGLGTDDAGKLYKNMHGQWYCGNLVTVKYMRDDRYAERFPESRALKIPLTLSN